MEKRTLAEWAKIYEKRTGTSLKLGTLRKRRALSGLGQVIPPRTYILSINEFVAVLKTPLPMCKMIVGVDIKRFKENI